jgi:hypothetical protein
MSFYLEIGGHTLKFASEQKYQQIVACKIGFSRVALTLSSQFSVCGVCLVFGSLFITQQANHDSGC